MGIECMLFCPFGVVAKHIAEEVRADIGLGHTVPIEANALCAKVVERVRESRNEMSAESPNILFAHLPDTEETEDVVHTIGIEIVLHLTEAALPPTEVILCHLIPVIGRESPVLSACIEVIGRCTCGCIEVEELRINSSIDRVRRDADRYITLHRHTDRVSVRYSVCQLLVRMELEELIEIFGLFVAFGEESGIGLQPLVILCLEGLVFFGAEEGIFVLLVEGFKEDHLGVIDVLVVRNREGVQFGFLRLVFLFHRRCEATHQFDIDVYRMEREDGHGVIGV